MTSEVTKITPSSVVTGVDFTDEINQVKGQLTTKVALNRKVKESWAELSSFLTTYGCNMGYRRKDIDSLDNYVSSVQVYDEPVKVEPSALEKAMTENNFSGSSSDSFRRSQDFDYFKTKHPKAAALIEEMATVYHKPTRQPSKLLNEEKTEAARAEARELIKAYVNAVIDSEENAEAMKSVGEYVDVVEKVAKIAGARN